MTGPVISVEYLSKRFKIYPNPRERLKEWLTLGGKKTHQEYWALKDVTFQVEAGECLGIIGPNGAGKSTLLKILTGSMHATSGAYAIQGKVFSLLELGTGFHQELTGRQNLYNSADLLGLPKKYLQEQMQNITEFANLGEYIDRPLKFYSSGMRVRLAFSLFVFLQPEVLIIDEALSVGDVFFQQKSFAKMRQIIESDAACLFVSHDTGAVQSICKRAILMQDGVITFIGDPAEAVSRYYVAMGLKQGRKAAAKAQAPPVPVEGALHREDILANNIIPDSAPRHGCGGVSILAARATDASGLDTMQVEAMQELRLDVLIKAHEAVSSLSAGLHLFHRTGTVVFASGSRQQGFSLPDLMPEEECVIRFTMRMDVQPDTYSFNLGTSQSTAVDTLGVSFINERVENLGPINVIAPREKQLPYQGLARLPFSVSCFEAC